MGIASHESARGVAIRDKQQAFGKFVSLGWHYLYVNLTMFAGQADAISGLDAQPLHVAGRHLQRMNFRLVFLEEFSLADSAALVAGATGNQNESRNDRCSSERFVFIRNLFECGWWPLNAIRLINPRWRFGLLFRQNYTTAFGSRTLIQPALFGPASGQIIRRDQRRQPFGWQHRLIVFR